MAIRVPASYACVQLKNDLLVEPIQNRSFEDTKQDKFVSCWESVSNGAELALPGYYVSQRFPNEYRQFCDAYMLSPERESMKFLGELRKTNVLDQPLIVNTVLNHFLSGTGNSAVINAFGGCGKTIMIAYLMCALKRQALFLTPFLDGVDQTVEELRNSTTATVCKLDGKKRSFNPNADIYVCTVQSILQRMPENMHFDLICLDEIQQMCGAQAVHVLLSLPPPRWTIGASATLNRRDDGLERTMSLFLGAIPPPKWFEDGSDNTESAENPRRKMGRMKGIYTEKNTCWIYYQYPYPFCVFRLNTSIEVPVVYGYRGKMNYLETNRNLSLNPSRVELFAMIIVRNMSIHKIVVICEYVEEAVMIYDKVIEFMDHPDAKEHVLLFAGDKPEPWRDTRVLIGTPGKVGIGMDAKNRSGADWKGKHFTVVIIANSRKSLGNWEQFMMRTFRVGEHELPVVLDPVDPMSIFEDYHWPRRLKLYRYYQKAIVCSINPEQAYFDTNFLKHVSHLYDQQLQKGYVYKKVIDLTDS